MLEVAVRRSLPGFTLDVAFQSDATITALLGSSGSGKSLTLRAIAGVFPVDAGRICQDGEVLHDAAAGIDLPPQQRGVGYVPQSYALFPHLSVAGNIAFGLRVRGAEAERLVAEQVAQMGLQGLERRRPSQLSGGQQQRVALARALILRPRLLLLDEPFAALDTTLRADLRTLVAGLPPLAGCTVLIVTHDPADAAIADRAFSMAHGRVVGG